MKTALKLTTIAFVTGLLLACAPTQYVISSNDGTMTTAYGKPKLDEATGLYTYKDAEGRAVTVKKEDVKQIMER